MNLRHQNKFQEEALKVREEIKQLLVNMYVKQIELSEKRKHNIEIGCYQLKPKGKYNIIRAMYSGYFKWRTIGTVKYNKNLETYININTIPGWLNEPEKI